MNRLFFGADCERDFALKCYLYIISFGGNLGEREKVANEVLQLMNIFGSVGRQSQWHYTQPLPSRDYDVSDHSEYLNFVFEFATLLAPNELYQKVRTIEDQFGRDRSRRWLPRAVDLDLLLCAHSPAGLDTFQTECAFQYNDPNGDLRIPHAELGKRLFLLDMLKTELELNLTGLLPASK